MNPFSFKIIVLLAIISTSLSQIVCHYSCASCTTADYYKCSTCNPLRGNNQSPVYGMCYCSNGSDENTDGNCEQSAHYNQTSKGLIIAFIALSIIFSVFMTIVKGMKYFLYKTIEDVQELSLIVFINLYFPQQFDIFLTGLYRFNISSYTFENVAMGTLFQTESDSTVVTQDGQNIYGKYKLLHKTANFFSNQFTWIIVAVCLIVFAVIIRFVRNLMKKKRDYKIIRKEIIKKQTNPTENEGFYDQSVHEVTKIEKKIAPIEKWSLYYVINWIYNILWYNFALEFFYFSVIEININIFTQIGNLTFSSPFATAGAFFSAVFLALQIVILVLLLLKAKEEMIKPQWMRDYGFTPTIYLIRTNYKTITKYFWFISVIKKILLAMMITLLYSDPVSSIIGVSCVHAIYLCIAIYCEPYERKYIRIHFYFTEGLKMFLIISLLDFTTKYVQFIELINLTQIFYAMLAFIFIVHFAFILFNVIVQRRVYYHFFMKKFCTKKYEADEQNAHAKIGYRSKDNLFIYEKE